MSGDECGPRNLGCCYSREGEAGYQMEWHACGRATRRGPVREEMGSIMGFSLQAADEPSLYWAGDTVLFPPIRETSPDIIVNHSCGAL